MSWILSLLFACSQQHWPDQPPAKACEAGGIPAGEYALTFEVEGRTRGGLVWMPEGPGPHDVIVTLHEMGSEPKRQAYYSKLVELARRENAILVAPDGRSATWNAGGCCGKSAQRNVKDGPFLDAMLEKVEASGCSSGRVLASGVGAGGMMAHRWACESDHVDAVLSVGGALQMPTCEQKRPIPVVHYHGDRDTWMPMDGSGGHQAVAEAERLWAERNGVQTWTTTAHGALSCRVGDGLVPTQFCVVTGMADRWPGAEDAPFEAAPGVPIDATADAWKVITEAWATTPTPGTP